MAVISGYHVDDYCVAAFRSVIQVLLENLSAEKITDLSSISAGDFVARIPPKIRSDGESGALRTVPVYQIKAVGNDFSEDGSLVLNGQPDYLYFETNACYSLDLNAEEPRFERSDESHSGAIDCFDAREMGRLKEKHIDVPDDLKGILYRIPADRIPDLP